ncbi:DUF4143 domain-containing protein [Denitratisoma sp. DHT3]|uniref:DUF4143 domain-containing protein n=1 Tax=Denitratisoma sp. DHT3 TaxID=1981880 RepID=UPI0016483F0D
MIKHTTTADGDYRLIYYRDADKVEVDVVIENAAGKLVGVEVKAAATVKESDLRGLMSPGPGLLPELHLRLFSQWLPTAVHYL